MAEEKVLDKVTRELDHLIAQCESLTNNLKACRRLTEKRKPRKIKCCGVIIKIGGDDSMGSDDSVYMSEFEPVDLSKHDFA